MPSLSDLFSFFSSKSDWVPQNVQFYQGPKDQDIQLIVQHTNNLTAKLKALQTIDSAIVTGYSLGLTAAIFTPFLSITILGFSVASYQLAKREQAVKEYQLALSNAIATWSWVIGDKTNNKNKSTFIQIAKQNTDSADKNRLMALFDALAPLMNEEQIKNATDNSVEGAFVAKADHSEVKLDLFNRPLSNQEKALYFGIYGYQQGSYADIGKGLWQLASYAVNWVKQKAQDIYHQLESLTHDDNKPSSPR